MIVNVNIMRFLIVFLWFIPSHLFSQVTGKVLDKSTNKGVSYTNIWVENENLGTTSDFYGNFSFDKDLMGKYLVFSAVGYERQRIRIEGNNLKVFLAPKVYEIGEALVSNTENSEKTVIGEFDKNTIRDYYGSAGEPWIVARYFAYQDHFKSTPFIKEIELLAMSDIEFSTFGLHFYSVDSMGMPGNEIVNDLILVNAKKGNNTITVNLSRYYIEIPEDGLFIAVEWLIIDENKFEFELMSTDTKKEKVKVVSYEPSIGNIPVENNDCSWIYNKGKWQKVDLIEDTILKDYKGKYRLLAFKLVLTN